jgi:RNA ligase (TIGR02306 family)
MRKLVTVRYINDIQSIDGADKIERVLVDGWNIVSEKGKHSVGDLVLFFEIDSFLPKSDSRYESFMKFGERTFEGVVGHRIKTVRLRGVYSQGIILPLSLFQEIVDPQLDTDYSELLGIVKWEAPQESGEGMGYQGDTKGERPYFIPKTDQERIQNLYSKLSNSDIADKYFVGTLKLDGSSCTVFQHPDTGEVGLCSRNRELKLEFDKDPDQQGKFFQGAVNSGLFEKVKQLNGLTGDYYAIQGELVGAGVQGGYEKFVKYQVFAYNIYNITNHSYVSYAVFKEYASILDLQICPEICNRVKILECPLNEILTMAEGASIIAPMREGVVWKELHGSTQFKAVSNKYLDKKG